jgi:hypothetical protein
MTEPTDLDKHKYDLAEKVWTLYRQILLKRGFDLSSLFFQWAQAQKDKFQNPGTRADFDELCEHGCISQVLVGLLFLTRYSPKLAPLWITIVGNPKARREAIQTLDSAANTLEQALGQFIALEDDAVRHDLQEFEIIPPSALVSELRLYSKLIGLAEILKSDAETRSPVEFARFLLTNYVERATGRPHDRNVATTRRTSLEVD